MAQSGYTPILIYGSGTATNVPLAANLTSSASGTELALNYADGKLFYKDSGGTVQVLATKGGVGSSTTTQVLYNSSGLVVGSANMVFDGSTLTTLNSAYTGTLTGGTGVVNLGSGQFYKDASGNVGIGTSSPNGKLSVAGIVKSTALSTIGNDGVWMDFSAPNGRIAAINSSGSPASNLFLATTTTGGTVTNAVTIDYNQNVGIGTGSPAFRLDVKGTSGNVTSLQATNATGSTAFSNVVLRLASNASGADTTINFTDATTYNAYIGMGSGALYFATNGATERMRIDNSGNVGIGTSSPVYKLDVAVSQNSDTSTRIYNANAGSSARATIVFGNNSNGGAAGILYNSSTNTAMGGGSSLNIYNGLSAPITFQTNATEAMRVTSGGVLCVGTTGPFGSAKTSLTGAPALEINTTGSTGVYPSVSFFNTNGVLRGGKDGAGSGIDAIQLYNGGIVLSVAYNGIGVATTTPAFGLDVRTSTLFSATGSIANGQEFCYMNGGDRFILTHGTSLSTASQMYFNNPNGTVGSISTSGTSTSYNTSSDYRLKDNVQPMVGALNKVTQLKPVTFVWNTDSKDGQGFIAHELAEVCPEAVYGEKDAIEDYGDVFNKDGTVRYADVRKPTTPEDGTTFVKKGERPVYQSVDTSFLVATLTAAIQEQQALITDLQARLTKAGL